MCSAACLPPCLALNVEVNYIYRFFFYFCPHLRYTKPASFADCVGDELPFGWEYAYHPLLGPYFIDHIRRVNQLDDPRIEWLAVQANMVIGYLQQANSGSSGNLLGSGGGGGNAHNSHGRQLIRFFCV